MAEDLASGLHAGCQGKPASCMLNALGYNSRPFLKKSNEDNMLRVMTSPFRATAACLIAGLLCLSMVGCSDPDELSAEQAAALEERVRARWQTIIDRDFEKTWEFATPNYRGIFPKHLYANNFSYGVKWELTGVDVLHYDGRAAVASVAARVMTETTKPTSMASKALGPRPVTIREKWILIDGEWWHSVNN